MPLREDLPLGCEFQCSLDPPPVFPVFPKSDVPFLSRLSLPPGEPRMFFTSDVGPDGPDLLSFFFSPLPTTD